jgi:hypothetical protein
VALHYHDSANTINALMLRWVKHVAHMRNAYKILVKTLKQSNPFEGLEQMGGLQ